LGYVAGISDALGQGGTVFGSKACIDMNVSIAQVRAIVVQWLLRHPEHRHRNGASTTSAALEEAFPCR
jgi:hypothetical protein